MIVWTTGRLAALSLGMEATGAVQASAAPGFGPKLQAGASIALILSIPLVSWMDLSTTLEGFSVLASDAAGGFLYRGFQGVSLAAALEAHFPVARSSALGLLSVGVAAGGAAALPAYASTTLYFFYPEVRLAAFLDWRPATASALAIRLDLPVRYQLRRDMSYSISTGLGIGASFIFGGSK